MRVVKLTLVLILFAVAASAQNHLPVIKSNSPLLTIQDGEQLKKDGWRLAPEALPDVYEAELINGKPHKVTFITDVDSISFQVELGKRYDFIIQWNDKLCYQRIVGTNLVPAAVFDKKYQAAHRGKILIEVPEVYELVNIAFAMTQTGLQHRNLIYKNSDYYKRMREWFDKYQSHPFLAVLDAELKKNFDRYHNLKMNAYSFEFDKNDRIVQSKVYNRSGWGRSNPLRQHLSQLQSFSDASNFRQFYKLNRKTYQDQITFYRDVANLEEMKRWLDKNFPTSNNYGDYKVIFSPLVWANQSSNSAEGNGFKELHAHVNFPYEEDMKRWFKETSFSKQAVTIYRGNLPDLFYFLWN